jgi:hypothetical protein
MSGRAKPTAREAFNDNLADAQTLVVIAKALRNKWVRRMRRELQERLGSALGLPQKHWKDLDCIESEELSAVFQPGASISRADLDEQALRPLLHQALVAACRHRDFRGGPRDGTARRRAEIQRKAATASELEGIARSVADCWDTLRLSGRR